MATALLLICALAAASAGGAERWELSEGTWECAGVDDGAEEAGDWPSGLDGLWVSQGCEPPQQWGGLWSVRSLLLEAEPAPPGGGRARARATLLRHVYADEWCARPLYSLAVVATLLHGEPEGGRSVRVEAASGCGHGWEGARLVLPLCCACAGARPRLARPHRQLALFSRAPPRARAAQRRNDASRRHAGPAPPVSEAAAAECLSRLWSELPVHELAGARVHTAPHRLGPRRTLLLPAGAGGGRSQPPLLHAAQARGCAACWAVARGSLTSPPQLAARPRLPASAAAAPTAPATWAAPGSCHPLKPAVTLHFDATVAAWHLQLEVRCAPAGPSWRAAASGGFWAEGAALRLRRARLAVEGAWAAGAAGWGCPPEPRRALLDVDAEGEPALLVWAAGCGAGAAPAPELLPPLRLRTCRLRAAAAAHVAGAAPADAPAASLLLLPLAVAALTLAGLPWR